MSAHKNDPPVDTLRDGQTFIKVWRNWSKDGNPRYSTTVGYTYTDQETGQPKESRSLRDSDLLRLPALAPRARESIRQFKDADRAQEQTRSVGNGPSQSSGASPQQTHVDQQRFRQTRQNPSASAQNYGREP